MEVLTKPNQEASVVLAMLSRDASIQKGFESKKMFLTKKLIGAENLHKLLCFILREFQESLKITNPENKMSASELFKAADRLMGSQVGEYGYESVIDILAAFKHFELNPFELYNAFNNERLTTIMTNYLETKAEWLERHNSQGKRDSTGIEIVQAVDKKYPGTIDALDKLRFQKTPVLKQFTHNDYMSMLRDKAPKLSIAELEQLRKEFVENGVHDALNYIDSELVKRGL